MMGRDDFERPTVQAVLEEPIHNHDSRRVYARAIVTKRNGKYYARLTGEQSSNVLTSMSRANGLAICPEDDPIKEAGEVRDGADDRLAGVGVLGTAGVSLFGNCTITS